MDALDWMVPKHSSGWPWIGLLVACLGAAAMWGYVQTVSVPLQVMEAEARGMPRGNLSDLYPR